MSRAASASPPAVTLCSLIQTKPQQSSYFSNPLGSFPVIPRTLKCSSNLKLKSLYFGVAKPAKKITLQCNSSAEPRPPAGSGDGESRTALDAFFLGKALAEALNKRIESAVGEFFSTIGRLQSQQQKQVQEFQMYLKEPKRQRKRQRGKPWKHEDLLPSPVHKMQHQPRMLLQLQPWPTTLLLLQVDPHHLIQVPQML